jgi:hypothetical protein
MNGSVVNGHDPNANGRALDSSMQAKAQQHDSQMALPQINGFQSPLFNGYPIAQNGNSSYIHTNAAPFTSKNWTCATSSAVDGGAARDAQIGTRT